VKLRILIENAHSLILVTSQLTEFLQQAGLLQSVLPCLGIKIEGAALRAGERMQVGLEDGTLYTMEMENARERQSSGARSDDGDIWLCWHERPSVF
jgi:hypothetical protein